MKVFLIGKRGSIVHWLEDSLSAFRAAGHEAMLGITRDPRLNRTVDAMLQSRALGVPRAVVIARAIARFGPDLIVTIGPFTIPASILERVAAIRGRPPLIGWVGDRFAAEARPVADLHDAIAYTDTGLLALHRALGFRPHATYLPHAANPRLGLAVPAPAARKPRLVFPANPTPRRRQVVGAIREPICLYGEAWSRFPGVAHEIDARRVSVEELGAIYRSHIAVLNVRNEINVLAGLNQRHFDPYLSATPVLTDPQDDIEQCFEPGREILVFRDMEELNAIHGRVRREPAYALAVGEAGRKRVLGEHTYAHRLVALHELARGG